MNIICIHGLAGSIYPYTNICEELIDMGYCVYMFEYSSYKYNLTEVSSGKQLKILE